MLLTVSILSFDSITVSSCRQNQKYRKNTINKTILILLCGTICGRAEDYTDICEQNIIYPRDILDSINEIKNDTLLKRNSNSLNAHIIFRTKQLIIPASFFFLGCSGLIEKSPLNRLSKKTQERVEQHNSKEGKSLHTEADNYIQYAPLMLHLGLGLVGAKSKHSLSERTIAAATAYGLMGILVNGMKYTIKAQRPSFSTRNSFPSGHSATAFAGAELTRIEYGNIYGSLAYGIAIVTGGLRIYNNRHWLHDVVTGAGIGILCTKAGYWMLPVWKRVFKFKDKHTAGSIVPYIDPNSKECYLSASFTL